MSARWVRCDYGARCGGCGQGIAIGDPLLELAIPNLHRHPVRCAACAGPAPPDLPPLVESASIAERVAALTRVGTAAPGRTRGALKTLAQADTWTPHRND